MVTTPARPICHRASSMRAIEVLTLLRTVSGLIVVVMCSILERGARLSPWRPQ